MTSNNQDLPPIFYKFFRWICHDDFIEELEGDLLESYTLNCQQKGRSYANWHFRKEVLMMIRPAVIKELQLVANPINPGIFKSHSKVALRNIIRHKTFSFLNISGLAIGMTVSLLIIALIADVLQFDQFHKHKEQIYRVTTNASYDNGRTDQIATAPLPLAELMEESIPGIESVVPMRRFFSANVRANQKVLHAKGHLADPEFFDVFSFPFVLGNPLTALSEPNSVVLTESMAEKFFSTGDAYNQVIRIGSYGDYTVKGVLKDLPKQSHMQFDLLASISTLPALEKSQIVRQSIGDWKDIYSNYTYIQISQNQDQTAIINQINELAQPNYDRFDDIDVSFSLQPLLGIVPGPEYSNKIGPSFTYTPLIVLSVIAFLILLTACSNYTNLSIARSLKRAKEVGLRKVIGASKNQICSQFLLESVIIALGALGFAVLLFQVIRPGFYRIIPRADQFNLALSPGVLFSFIIFAVFTGLLAGMFPALVLSRTRPILVLNNLFSSKINKRFTLRKALITFQFALSIIFIVGASIVLKQYKYALNKDFGFNQENILNVSLYDSDYQLFNNEISKIPGVQEISYCSNIAGLGSTNTAWVKGEALNDSIVSYFIAIDDHYLANHEFKIIAGRAFEKKESPTKLKSVIINEAFLKAQNWTYMDVLNTWLTVSGENYEVVGIVQDFNYTHLEEPIKPFVFIENDAQFNYANLKIVSTDIAQTIATIEAAWVTIDPINTFQAQFLDEQIDRAYDFLKNAITLFSFLAFLTITIACLGMLGMAMYAAETRAKEVSIRKVFGASLWNIFHTLSKRFYILLTIATIIALPIVYLIFDNLILSNFAFRVSIGLWELLSGLLVVLILGLLSISSQTIRVARINPADSLRGL